MGFLIIGCIGVPDLRSDWSPEHIVTFSHMWYFDNLPFNILPLRSDRLEVPKIVKPLKPLEKSDQEIATNVHYLFLLCAIFQPDL